jgi:hypothetical protein
MAKQWINRYYQERAGEAQALRRAAAEGIGHYFSVAGDEYIAWPNGEISQAAEYEHWLNLQRVNAQYGAHG